MQDSARCFRSDSTCVFSISSALWRSFQESSSARVSSHFVLGFVQFPPELIESGRRGVITTSSSSRSSTSPARVTSSDSIVIRVCSCCRRPDESAIRPGRYGARGPPPVEPKSQVRGQRSSVAPEGRPAETGVRQDPVGGFGFKPELVAEPASRLQLFLDGPLQRGYFRQ